MSITDELRKWAHGFNGPWRRNEEMLLAIADRIDAEHEKAEQDLIDANNQMEQLCECSIRLPVDADGVPIHVGDKVTEHEDGHTFKVDGFMDWDGEWWVFMRDGIQAPASRCTHYHEPTVEDVLRAMLDALDVDVCADPDATIAEYAKRLRLVEEDE